MNKLITDLKQLILNHWKPILVIAVVVFMLSAYADIKQGMVDGWLNK